MKKDQANPFSGLVFFPNFFILQKWFVFGKKTHFKLREHTFFPSFSLFDIKIELKF
jgi:hypothetical protein